MQFKMPIEKKMEFNKENVFCLHAMASHATGRRKKLREDLDIRTRKL